MYLCKSLLDHLPMIIVISRYTCASKRLTENIYRKEWVNNSLYDKPSCYYLKESVPDLIYLFSFDMLLFLFYTHTVFTGVSSDVPGYDSNIDMMSSHICTRHESFPIRHWVTVAFLTPFFCVLKAGDIWYSMWM